MSRLDKLNKELSIAKAMRSELQETIDIDTDSDGKLESKRLYKFLNKTTMQISKLLQNRLDKLDNIITDINADIERVIVQDVNEYSNSVKEEQTSDTITEFEKLINYVFSESPFNVKVVRTSRD